MADISMKQPIPWIAGLRKACKACKSRNVQSVQTAQM